MLRVLHGRIDWSWIVNKYGFHVWWFIKLSNKHIHSQKVYFKGESKKLKKKSNEKKKKKKVRKECQSCHLSKIRANSKERKLR